MSSRNKLFKFAEVLTFPHVVQNFDTSKEVLVSKDHEEVQRKGLWAKNQFQNDLPIVLELACGRGEYALGLAALHPQKNFIGVDVKGARIWQGAKLAIDQELDNVAFLRCRIESISKFFGPGEVDEIWITFPDPFLKDKKSNRRLTSPYFLNEYRRILKPGGRIHLKTDEPILYDFSLEVLESEADSKIHFRSRDLYKETEILPEWQITTHYENLHIADGDQICFLEFSLSD